MHGCKDKLPRAIGSLNKGEVSDIVQSQAERSTTLNPVHIVTSSVPAMQVMINNLIKNEENESVLRSTKKDDKYWQLAQSHVLVSRTAPRLITPRNR
jgi:hypothetical protein